MVNDQASKAVEEADLSCPPGDTTRMSDKQLLEAQEKLAQYLSTHVADMRETFVKLLSCPEAGDFMGFFDHVADMHKKGEPAYKAMYEV